MDRRESGSELRLLFTLFTKDRKWGICRVDFKGLVMRAANDALFVMADVDLDMVVLCNKPPFPRPWS